MRPVIVGMCHPSSDDPDDVLELRTSNASGERLWKMMREAVPITKADFRRRFEFVNVSPSGSFKMDSATADKVKKMIGKRPAIVLGRQTWMALRLTTNVAMFSRSGNWHLIGHPSGRNLLYNDPENRRAAGKILARVGGMMP